MKYITLSVIKKNNKAALGNYMRVFKTKPFSRFSSYEGIDDALLCEAVKRAESGLVDAELGGGSLSRGCHVKAKVDPAYLEALFSSDKATERFLHMALPRTNVRT